MALASRRWGKCMVHGRERGLRSQKPDGGQGMQIRLARAVARMNTCSMPKVIVLARMFLVRMAVERLSFHNVLLAVTPLVSCCQ
jgi:hypothetical protein